MAKEGIVFEGGGVLGLAYAGALEVLEKNGQLKGMTKFAGTSIGALPATFLACNIDIDNVIKHLIAVDFNVFLDNTFGVIRDMYRLYKYYGWYMGDSVYDWIGDILKSHDYNPDISFLQLFKKTGNHLIITGTNMERKPHSELFSYTHTPDMPVRLAIRISVSMPVIFQPISYNGYLYCDGGLTNNFPIEVFDAIDGTPNMNIIGLKLCQDYELMTELPKIQSATGLLNRMCDIIYNQAMEIAMSDADIKRTVIINVKNFSGLNFTLLLNDKLKLVDLGRQATLEHFKQV